jgi:uncharacterized protein
MPRDGGYLGAIFKVQRAGASSAELRRVGQRFLQSGGGGLCSTLMTDVIHNEAANRYTLSENGATAFAHYVRRGDVMTFDHTVTPPELRGRGIASRIVAFALADVRARGMKIVPACSFVADFVARHPEVGDLVAG